MQDGALDHALKAQRGLGFHFIGARYQRRVLFDEFGQVLAQLIQVGAAGAQHIGGRGVVEHGQQQVFNADELMAFLTCVHEGHVQAHFKFLGDHPFSSITHCKGCW